VTPDTITWFGLALAIGAAALIINRYLLAAGVLVLVAGFFDILDGALARATNRATRFGAILDSTLDRVSEAILLLGILFLYCNEQSIAGSLLVGLALIGSMLVSYIRARAEAIGYDCQVGLFTRAERVAVLALGLMLNQVFIALVIIVIFSLITVSQRLLHIWRQTRS